MAPPRKKTVFGLCLFSLLIYLNTNVNVIGLSKEQAKKSSCDAVSGNELIFTNSTMTFPHPPTFQPVSKLLPAFAESEEEKGDDAAVCQYKLDGVELIRVGLHHPHFLQVVMRCFSYWQIRPDQSPIMTLPNIKYADYVLNPTAFAKEFPFSNGLLQGLKDSIKLTVTGVYKFRFGFKIQQFMENDATVSPFSMSSRKDAINFRHIFVPSTRDQEAASRRQLNIGIINRAAEHRRTLLNGQQIQSRLATIFPQHKVVLKYFENCTFQEQIDTYSQMDVVISPHGAQLTGIMFMPPCSGVLEIFPHGYYTQYYFSSLARVFGLQHANWYLSDEKAPTWQENNYETRFKNTGNNMCPVVDRVALFVRELIKRREECLAVAASSSPTEPE